MKPEPSRALLIVTPLIRLYQWCISPWLGTNCRFTPTCSHYAHEAIGTHGLGKGSVLTFKRLCRCHPFAASGFDPVPPKFSSSKH
jgi:putative membrane protein insertion efficiency factor